MTRFSSRLFCRGILSCSLQLTLALSWVQAAADDFTVEDIVVSNPQVPLPDPEFDQIGSRMTWQDGQGNLWVTDVDPVTGLWTPPSGRQLQLDTNLAPISWTGNGPEWVYAADGSQIVYTKRDADNTMRLVRARRDVAGAWQVTELVRGQNRFNPIGSKDVGDTQPRIAYFYTLYRDAMWREVDAPLTERDIPTPSQMQSSWVEGERALTIVSPDMNGVNQCAEFNIDTQDVAPISWGTLPKRYGYVWRAPEYGNDKVAYCLEQSGSVLLIYRKLPEGWTKLKTMRPPSRAYFYSVEHFIYNGASYLVFLTQDISEGGGPADVWIAGIDPVNGLLPHQVSSSANPTMVRMDPEVFITTQGPYVYYTEKTQPPDPETYITHRCATGL